MVKHPQFPFPSYHRRYGRGEVGYRPHHPARGGVDEKGDNGAPIKCGWEDVVFEPSRVLGEVREVEFLCIFDRSHFGWVRLISAWWWFLSRGVASFQ